MSENLIKFRGTLKNDDIWTIITSLTERFGEPPKYEIGRDENGKSEIPKKKQIEPGDLNQILLIAIKYDRYKNGKTIHVKLPCFFPSVMNRSGKTVIIFDGFEDSITEKLVENVASILDIDDIHNLKTPTPRKNPTDSPYKTQPPLNFGNPIFE